MIRFIAAFIMLLFVIPLFSINGEWIGKISEVEQKELEKEIKVLEKELKNDKSNYEIITKLGFCYHFLSIKGKKVAQKSINSFEESLKIKEDNLIRAYYASAVGLLGGEKMDLTYLNKCFKIMDEVLEKDPENESVLILALTNSLAMPDFVFPKREPVAKKSLETLEKMYSENKLSEGFYPVVLLKKGDFLLKQKNLTDAKKTWKEIVEKFPDTKSATDSKKLLDKYSE
ncbi:MAG TPA: hypothetical protein PK771_04525 [Spirochaetota bacterium]|nr:hypothetical protein [Spirochaetota bacterium]